MLTGAGYIGAVLLRRLDAAAAPVVALDNFFSSSRECVQAALPKGVQLIDGDVSDASDVARAFDVLGTSEDITVFHLAAQPSAAIAKSDPARTERSNLTGARVLLEAARERDASVIFGGSFRVYGDDLANTCVDEQTPYGRVGDLSHLSKIYVEQLARMLGVHFVSVRLGVTYGLSPVMKTTPTFMTVPNLFCQRAAKGEPLKVLEDRPMAFVHVEDAADALLTAAQLRGQDWRVVNAAPEVATIGQLARTVQALVPAARIEGDTGLRDTYTVRSSLTLRPKHTLESGLGEVLEYFRARDSH